MARRQALFPGDSEFQQLLHIFRLLGTPSEKECPGVSSLRDWHTYPHWEPQNLAKAVSTLGPDGVDLLSKMLKYDPGERISAKEAMDHAYFDSLDKSQFLRCWHLAFAWLFNYLLLLNRSFVGFSCFCLHVLYSRVMSSSR